MPARRANGRCRRATIAAYCGGSTRTGATSSSDDGVLVEIESLTLSRDLPAIIGGLIRPIVNNTARESMTRTLASVRARFAD